VADLVYPPVITLVKGFWKYLGFRFDFEGDENIPRKGGAILAINHVSYLDFAIAGTAALPVKRFVRFMAKKELFDHKIAGPLLRGMHHISVDRSNGAPSYVAALKALNSGEIIGIFPEATISISFEIKQLKSGAIRLAADTGAPIIPTIVWGGQRVSTKGLKPNFKRGKTPVSVSFGEPIYYAKDVDIEIAAQQLREVMISMLNQVQEKYPESHVGQRWAPARLGGTAPAPLN
jgi:1-acyl-sn-glycerol-3-phosphate acyltransferase